MNQNNSASSWVFIGYGLIVFLSSACLLIIEMTASRLLAPYVGVSLYTWTAIIGVILAGLSLGNWLGGVLADRGYRHPTVAWTLMAGGLFTLCIPQLLLISASWLQGQSLTLVTASVMYVSILFLIPAVVIGIVTPLLTTLALAISIRAGHIVGGLHAVAAVGSIVGTFAAGFWLIPWLGTRWVILASGILLLVMGLVFWPLNHVEIPWY